MFRMLLIEDSARFRQAIRMVLSTYFPQTVIEEAADGTEAMEKLRAVFPDLIFLDLRLPGENGFSLTKKIKSIHPRIPIIILTSYDLQEYKDAAYQAGADYFLSKSTSSGEQLAEIVSTVMEGRNGASAQRSIPVGRRPVVCNA